MHIGIIGSGSWATALAKILTDNGQRINWYIRNPATIQQLLHRRHNPHYLSAAYFDVQALEMNVSLEAVVAQSDVLVMAIPSAYIQATLEKLPPEALQGKTVVSAIKGILPGCNLLLNEYLAQTFQFPPDKYLTLLGPCHAEEVAGEKLSYLTFSGSNPELAAAVAQCFRTEYINTVVNADVMGAQYAAVLKNIYALGAGIAHGLEYGDNFQSVYIANAAGEMENFLQQAARVHGASFDCSNHNYSASVYLGDLLVTCYSLFSRNRTFGNMLGKGYSVQSATLELNMVAEGYNASKCIYLLNQDLQAHTPIALILYEILWNQLPAADGFARIEKMLV